MFFDWFYEEVKWCGGLGVCMGGGVGVGGDENDWEIELGVDDICGFDII